MKIKKFFSLVLALAMVLSLAAPAFAVTAEEDVHVHDSSCEAHETTIQPRVPTLPCCGARETEAYEYRYDTTHGSAGRCVFGYSRCNDYYATKYHVRKCGACGANLGTLYTESGYYCPTEKNYRY